MQSERSYFMTLLLTILLLGSMVPNTHAQTNDNTANKLYELFEKTIENQKDNLVPKLGATLLFDGPINVEKTPGYYAVTLPHIKALYPEGEVFELGMISTNVLAEEVAGRWAMAIALPTPMVFLDEYDSPILQIHIGKQSASGVWDERLGGFMNFESTYENIKIEGGSLDYALNIPSLEIRYDFSDNLVRIDMGETSFTIPKDLMFGPSKEKR